MDKTDTTGEIRVMIGIIADIGLPELRCSFIKKAGY
jgi:hypothetical protein